MKSYILLLGLLLGGFTAYADSTAKKETEAILIGHVVDSRSGEHLPFITITVKGTTIGTTTDVSGHYLLGNLPVGRPLTVVAQSVGYKSAERSVTLGAHSTTELNFELEEQAAITLSAGKENFNGEFSVKISTKKGCKKAPTILSKKGTAAKAKDSYSTCPGYKAVPSIGTGTYHLTIAKATTTKDAKISGNTKWWKGTLGGSTNKWFAYKEVLLTVKSGHSNNPKVVIYSTALDYNTTKRSQ